MKEFAIYKEEFFITMKRYIELIILSQIIFCSSVLNQYSLNLVATIDGPDTKNPINDVKCVGDMNGDGYDDILVSFTNYCNIYLGGNPFDLVPDMRFEGRCFLAPGDVNNDNYADVIMGHYELPGNFVSELYFGGKVIDTIPDFTYRATKYLDEQFSPFNDKIGDVNNDGYDDFILSGYYNWSNGLGNVYLFYGGESINEIPDLTFTGKIKDYNFGWVVSGIGDTNNDGNDDIMIVSYDINKHDSSSAYLYYGGSEMDTTVDRVFTGLHEGESYFGLKITNAGNLNGDQYNNFIISSLMYSYIYLNLDSAIVIPHTPFGPRSIVVTYGGGDINHDGFNDFIIGSEAYRNENDSENGASFIYYGNSSLDTVYDQKIEGENHYGYFSIPSYIGGDINGDGYDEVFILAKQYPDYTNYFGRLYIYSYKKLLINSIEPKTNLVPQRNKLLQNYPNPFNSTTTIQFNIKEKSKVTLSINDCLGKNIITLVNQDYKCGNYHVQWNGKNQNNQSVSSGIYFIKMTIHLKNDISYLISKKILYIR